MAFKLSLSQNQTAKAGCKKQIYRCGLVLPAQACFDGTLFSAERAAVAHPVSDWMKEKQGGSVVVPTVGFEEDAELSRAGRAPGGHWAQAK